MPLSKGILLTIVLAPLFGAIVAGLFGRQVGRRGAHIVTMKPEPVPRDAPSDAVKPVGDRR